MKVPKNNRRVKSVGAIRFEGRVPEEEIQEALRKMDKQTGTTALPIILNEYDAQAIMSMHQLDDKELMRTNIVRLHAALGATHPAAALAALFKTAAMVLVSMAYSRDKLVTSGEITVKASSKAGKDLTDPEFYESAMNALRNDNVKFAIDFAEVVSQMVEAEEGKATDAAKKAIERALKSAGKGSADG